MLYFTFFVRNRSKYIYGIRGRFAQSIDIDGGKLTLYLYSYEANHTHDKSLIRVKVSENT